ncbi:MAG: hypothetical protein YFSK_5020 [Candidatus Yanofskyibacterium parasiticum]|nr:MAG: hypothetical protein YFSK_5020 [Candidatus Yanofskybacteria bacterium]
MNQKKLFSFSVLLAMVLGIGFGSVLRISAQADVDVVTVTGTSVPATIVSSSSLAKEPLLIPETVSAVVKKQTFGAQSQNEPIILNAPKGIDNAMKASASAMASSITGAVLTIFSVSSGTISSSISGHAFITVKNVSTGGLTINIGRFSGIASGKTMSLGTWSNTVTTEHNGLWYNLEAYKLAKNGAFSGRVSVSYLLNATQLNNLNNYIINHDSWSLASPCSSFAVNAWNSVVDSSYRLSAGTPSTPTNLKNNIQSKFKGQYATNGAIPYNYVVYYAKGTGSPVKSIVFK